MAQTSTYSYTERKRIRKSFGSRENVLAIPYLLQMQKDAYTAFLQADTAPKKRTPEGLHQVLPCRFVTHQLTTQKTLAIGNRRDRSDRARLHHSPHRLAASQRDSDQRSNHDFEYHQCTDRVGR